MSWVGWHWDLPTALWTAWLMFGFLLEGWAVATNQPPHTLTWHVRPVLTSAPVVYYMTCGFYVWLGLHFLAPRWESWLLGRLL